VEQAGGIHAAGAPGALDEVATIARAIKYAAGYATNDGGLNTVQTTQPARVIDISIGNIKTACPTTLQDAIDMANAANVVVVA
jgi:hypothetical protein